LGFLREKVGKLENVIVHPVALGDEDGTVVLRDCKRDGASVYATIGDSETVQCVDVSQAMDEIGPVDLMHLNAEGAELDILDRLMDTGQIANIERIMVQWHVLSHKKEPKISSIASRLLKTHVKQRGYRAWNLYQLRKSVCA
jgi:FkbM family methyltransferase